jgi:hypothetical protein
MEPLQLGDREIPIAMPDLLDVLGLAQAFVRHEKKPAALGRLKLAAIGLCWWAAVDAMPTKTREDREAKKNAEPGFGRLDDFECDLLQFGKAVAAAEFADVASLREVQARGDILAGELFKHLAPSPQVREKARGNSSAGEATSDTSSASAPSTFETPSPVSG